MSRAAGRWGALAKAAAILPWIAPAAALGVVAALSGAPAVERLRDLVFDEYQAFSPRPWSPDLPVRVIDIDEESLARLGQWPWPRDRLAALARRLTEAGAAAIAFDVLFAEADRASPERIVADLPDLPETRALAGALAATPGHDAAFALALGEAPSVLAMAMTHDPGAAPPAAKSGFATAGDDPRRFLAAFAGATQPLPVLATAAKGLGAINFLPDRDLVLRKVPTVFALQRGGDEAPLVPALAIEALRVAQGASTIIVKSSNASGEEAFGAATGVVALRIGAIELPTDRDGAVRVRYAGEQPGRRIPAWRALAGEVPASEIEGRILFVGASAAALADLRSTPLQGAAAGVDVHAELVEHALSGARLARPDYAPGVEAFLVLLLTLATGLLATRAPPTASALGGAALAAATLSGSYALFARADLLIDAVVPSLAGVGAWAATTVGVYRRAERERRRVRAAFRRYLSPVMVDRLADDASGLRLGGETRNVTILFSDVRDFTARSETLDAAGVVAFLNRLHTPTTACVLAEGGTIDKYLGDGLMAFWNAPLETPDHPTAACRAALALVAAVADLDRAMAAEAAAAGRRHQAVRIGVGLNTGEAFVGNMGSAQRFDYSIVGDAVNVAARLESATKAFGVPILATAATRAAARGLRFAPLGGAALKGKAEEEPVFALHGPAREDDRFDDFLAAHQQVLEATDPAGFDAALAAVRIFPQAAAYAAFYASRRVRLSPGS